MRGRDVLRVDEEPSPCQHIVPASLWTVLDMLKAPVVLTLVLAAGLPFTSAFAGEGYDAGYGWAEDNDIEDASICDTPSSSFNQGCEDYVEDQPTSSPSDDEGEDEDEE